MDQRWVASDRTHRVGVDIATAKIGVPVLPDWVIPRPRLTARIGKGARGPLTVVTGAPGAGKTVAVASWAVSGEATTTAPGPVGWMTVDEGDADPDVFWRYLLETLRRIGVGPPPSGRTALRADGVDHVRIAELASVLARRDTPVVLVLDDFRPAVGSVLVTGMAYLLKLARPWLRLVITSRRDLPLPLHRHRLTGDLTEIRAEDLAFSERETDQLLAQHGVVLSRDSVRALRDRTEGWAAGLRLAAMSMAGHPDPDGFVAQATDGDHAIAGYLVEEVLDAQRPAVRRLLLATSILDRVNAEIAAELTPGIGGPEFAEVVGQNSFIRPLGDGWYRYHQMFRDVLRLRLRHENPGRPGLLHRRAAAWFSAQGLLTDAVGHAAAAQEWQLACGLVIDRLAVGDVLGLRPVPVLGAVLRKMPERLATAGVAQSLVTAALRLARGDGDGYRTAAARGAQLLAELPDAEAVPARLTAALLRLVHARGHHEAGVGAVTTEIERFLDRLPNDLVDTRPEVRALALTGRADTGLWAGQWAQAADSFAAAHSVASAAGSEVLRADCLAHGALAEVFRGRWSRAAELADQAARVAAAQPLPPGWRVPALPVVRAWIALERYQLAEARHELDQAAAALRERCHPLLAAVRGLVSARLDSAEGRTGQALDTLHRTAVRDSTPCWLVRRLLLAEAEVHAAITASAAAWQAAARAGGSDTPDGSVALAGAQLCAGRAEEALGTLRPALTEALPVRAEVRVAAWLLDAQASYATGDASRGRRSLDRALRLGEREQLRLPFAMCAPWLRAVLRSDQELVRHYPRLLEPLRIGRERPGGSAGSPDPGLLLSRQLSDRELEVLRHLAQMRTSEEIAAEMYVSINTVKTHLKSIYRKLAVTRRGDAVRRAQQLELLTPGTVPLVPSVSAARSEQAPFTRPPDGLGAGRHAQLAVDQTGVALDGVRRDE
jgi:LuxR family transcriptional regulator, maltose regulon positive regulatory protein